MKIGVFSEVIKADSVAELAMRIKDAHNLDAVQLRLALPGVTIDPESPDASACDSVRTAFADRSVEVAALACYVNLVAPDPKARAHNLRQVKGSLKLCQSLATRFVTTESGSFHPDDEWEADPYNYSAEGWQDMLRVVEDLVRTAEDAGSVLVIEPYVLNVVNTPEAALRLIRDIASERLRLLFDPAGLLYRQTSENPQSVRDLLRRAVDLMGEYIALVHVEDVYFDPRPHFVGAGKGVLDYGLFMQVLTESGYDGALILEHLREKDIVDCRGLVVSSLDACRI